MKWLSFIGVWAATVIICGALGFIVGLFYTPSLDEGSHGMFIPVMLGLLGCQGGIPVGLVVGIVWLVRRVRQEKKEHQLVNAMIDAASPPIQSSLTRTPNKTPQTTTGSSAPDRV